MKNKLGALVLFLIVGMAAQAKIKVSVSGEIVGAEDSCRVSLTDAEGYKPKTLASTKFTGQNFSLSCEVKSPRMVTLEVSTVSAKSKKWVKCFSVRTMVDATPLQVKVDKKAIVEDRNEIEYEAAVNAPHGGISIHGGAVTEQFAEYLSFTRPLEWASQRLGYDEAEAWFANGANDDAIAYMKVANDKALADYQAKVHDFILLHPDYAVSAALVAAKAYKPFSFSGEDFEKEYAAIKNNADTAHVNFITRNLTYLRTHATGADYTDFVAKDKKGKDVKLSSLRQPGKMTLVDFWASWCGPCRSAIPKIKAMAEKYADKLQVVSCSVDEKKEAWLKAEKAEAMPWPQLMLPLSDLQSKDGASVAYDISSIPRLVVIDADGKVLVVTHSPAVVEKVIAANL